MSRELTDRDLRLYASEAYLCDPRTDRLAVVAELLAEVVRLRAVRVAAERWMDAVAAEENVVEAQLATRAALDALQPGDADDDPR